MRTRSRYIANREKHSAVFGDRGAFEGDGMYNMASGYLLDQPQTYGQICKPYIRSDIQPYESPITGKMITTRSERRYDLEASGCIEVDPATRRKGFKNPFFAKKHGVRLAEEYTKSGDARPEVELANHYDVDPKTVVNRAGENRVKQAKNIRRERVKALHEEKAKDHFTRAGWETVKQVERISGDARIDLGTD